MTLSVFSNVNDSVIPVWMEDARGLWSVSDAYGELTSGDASVVGPVFNLSISDLHEKMLPQ